MSQCVVTLGDRRELNRIRLALLGHSECLTDSRCGLKTLNEQSADESIRIYDWLDRRIVAARKNERPQTVKRGSAGKWVLLAATGIMFWAAATT